MFDDDVQSSQINSALVASDINDKSCLIQIYKYIKPQGYGKTFAECQYFHIDEFLEDSFQPFQDVQRYCRKNAARYERTFLESILKVRQGIMSVRREEIVSHPSCKTNDFTKCLRRFTLVLLLKKFHLYITQLTYLHT